MSWFYEQPGFVNDFNDARAWHRVMARSAAWIVEDLVAQILGRAPTTAEVRAHAPALTYVDPVVTPPPADAETMPIQGWVGFPRAVKRRRWELPAIERGDTSLDVDGVYRAADSLGDEDHGDGRFVDAAGRVLTLPVRHRQDEYLEWRVERDAEGRITRAVFVAEGYDYFSALFDDDSATVVEMFRDATENRRLVADDLRALAGVFWQDASGTRQVVRPGGYNVRHRFNVVDGIVHLSHRANSLSAEINLAGVSGIARRTRDGALLTNEPGAPRERYLCCSAGGNPNRNSDPLIAQQAYAQVLAGYRYTLANPVGLYIVSRPAVDSIQTWTGEPVPDEWWTVTRGDEGSQRILRLELAVPPGTGKTVSDLSVDGVPVLWGGQIAELLRVHLFVTRWRRAEPGVGPVVPCVGTCCQATDGSERLFLSSGPCGQGTRARFPELLGAPATPASGGRGGGRGP